jgi:hypothetical protein
MTRWDYNYSCSGCGSGTSCGITILKDGVTDFTGSEQFACTVTEAEKVAAVIAKRPYASTDTAYVNDVLYYSPPSPSPTPPPIEKSDTIILLIAIAVAGYLLLRG